jgi:putative transposase
VRPAAAARALVTSADVQDCDGGLLLLSTLFGQFPFLTKLFAHSAYAGPMVHDGLAGVMPDLVTEVVRRCEQVKASSCCPDCWIVERTIGWLGRCRRLAKDWPL